MNAGATLEIVNGGSLLVLNTLNVFGTVEVNDAGATLTVQGPVIVGTHGTIEAINSGASIFFSDTTSPPPGTYTVDNSGKIAAIDTGAAIWFEQATTKNEAGGLIVGQSGGKITFDGGAGSSIHNSGTVETESGGTITFDLGIIVDNSSTISAGTSATAGGAITFGAATLTNEATGVIEAQNGGAVIIQTGKVVANLGTIQALTGGTIALYDNIDNSAGPGLIHMEAGGALSVDASVTVTGGTISTDAKSLSYAAGEIDVGASIALTLTDEVTVDNSGLIALGANSHLYFDQTAAALDDTGAVTMAAGSDIDVGPTAPSGTYTLTNDNTIMGQGEIGSGFASITNMGSIEATTGTLTIDPTAAPAAIDNSSTLGADGVSATLKITDVPVTNTGTLLATGGGTVALDSEVVTNGSGTVEVDTGSFLTLTGINSIANGKLVNSGSVTDLGALTLSSGIQVTNTGAITIGDGIIADTLTLSGTTVTGTGSITVKMAATLTATGTDMIVGASASNQGSITNTGTITDNGDFTLKNETVTNTGGTFTVGGPDTLTLTNVTFTGGHLTVASGATLDLNNTTINGVILSDTGAIINITGDSKIDGVDKTISGMITVDTGQTLVVDHSLLIATVTNKGTGLTAGTVKVDSGTTSDFGGTATITGGNLVNLGTINIFDPSVAVSTVTLDDVQVTNAGAITVGDGSNADELTLNGDTVTGTGSITVDHAAILTLTGTDSITGGGTLSNSGTINADGAVSFDNETVTNSAGGKIVVGDGTNTDTLTLSGTTISNIGGTITIAHAATLDLVGGTLSGGSITNHGTIESSGTSAIDGAAITDGGVTVTGGTLTLSADTLTHVTLDQQTGGSLSNAGALTLKGIDTLTGELNNSNTITIGAAATLDLVGGTLSGGSISNHGTIESSGTSAIDGATITGGKLTVQSDTLTLGSTNTLSGVTVSDGGSLSNAGTLTFKGSDTLSGDLANSGTITIGAAAVLDLVSGTLSGGAISNHGTIDSNGSSAIDGATITGGKLTVQSDTLTLGSTNTLSGVTVSDGGSLSNAGALTLKGIDTLTGELNNSNTITIGAAATLDLVGGTLSGGSISNHGTIESSGTSAIDGAAITDGGVTVTGGTLTLSADTLTHVTLDQQTGGSLSNAGALTLKGIDTLTGELNNSNTITIGAAATLDLVGGTLSGGSITNHGTIESSGTSAIDGAAITDGGVTVTGGTLTLSADTLTHVTLDQQTGGSLSNAGALTLKGIDTLTGELNNSNTITIGAAATLDLVGGTLSGGSITNHGTIESSGTSAIDGAAITDGGVTVTGGTLTLSADTLTHVTLDQQTGGSLSNAGALTLKGIDTLTGELNNSNTITIGAAATLDLVGGTLSGGSISNHGTIESSGTSAIDGAAITDGGVTVTGGTLTLSADTLTHVTLDQQTGGSLSNAGALTLKGIDTLTGELNNSNTITIGAAATLDLVGGTLSGGSITNHGTIDTTGTSAIDDATLTGGKLTVATGTLTLGANTFSGVDVINTATGILSNTGALKLTGSDTLAGDLANTSTITIGAAATLDLVGGTLSGGSISNHGTIDTTGTSAIDDATLTGGKLTVATGTLTLGANTFSGVDVINTATGILSNTGALKLTGSDTLAGDLANTSTITIGAAATLDLVGGTLSGGSITNHGTIDTTGTSAIDDATLTGGKLTVATGTLTLGANTFSGVDVINTATGILSNTGALKLTGSDTLAGDLANTSTITIGAAATLDLVGGTLSGGSISNHGTIDTTGTSAIDDATLTGGKLTVATGTLTLGANTFSGVDVINTATGILSNTGALKLTGSDTLAGDLANTSTITIGAAATLDLVSGTLSGGSITNHGTIDTTGTSAIDDATLTGGKLTVATGTLTLGANTFSGVDVINTATGILSNTGALKLTGSDTLAGDLANTSTITIGAAATLDLVGGTLSGGSISNHGTIAATSGNNDIATGTTVNNGGTLEVTGGALTIDGSVHNSGTLEANGGTLVIASDADITGSNPSVTITNGGMAEFAGGSSGQPLDLNATFSGSGALQLDHSQYFGGTLTGFASGDTIDLKDIGYASGETNVWNGGNDTLTITNGTHTATLTFASSYTQNDFALTSDGGSGTPGTDVVWSPAQASLAGLDSAGNAVDGEAVTASLTDLNATGITYTWLDNGQVISGQTGHSFMPTGDQGDTLDVVISFTDNGTAEQMTALAGVVDPAAPIITTLVGQPVNGDAIEVQGSGENGDTVTLYNGATVVGTDTVVGGAFDITTTATFSDGNYTLTATETDSANSTSATSAGFAVAVDPAAPVITTLVGQPVDGDAIEVQGSGESGDTVTLYNGATVVGTGTVVGGAFDITTTATFPDGNYTLTATETDSANSTSAASAGFAVAVDPETQTLTITVEAPSGFQQDVIPEIGAGTVQGGGTMTGFTIVDTAADVQFVFDGNGLMYDSSGGPITVTAGTITGWQELTNDASPTAIANFTGVSIAAAAFIADAQTAANTNNFGPINSLTTNVAFDFDGSLATAPLNFMGSNNADVIIGGSGSDILDGAGAPSGQHDTLTGGAGSNTFMFSAGYGALTITDFDQGSGSFNAAESDQIEVSGFTTNPTVSYANGNTVLDLNDAGINTNGVDDVLTLQGVTQSEFTALNGSEFIDSGGGNNNPTINNAGNTVTYTGTPVTLDQSLTISDSATITGLTATISAGARTGDTLTINGAQTGTLTNTNDGSTIAYNYYNGVMTLSVGSGTPTIGDFVGAEQGIQYSTSNSDPTDGGTDAARTVTWEITDSNNHSSPAVTTTVDIEVNNLAVTLSGVTNDGNSILGQPVSVATVTEAGVAVTSGLTYQWELDNNPISGQTASSYTPQMSDEGHQLSVLVTDSSDGDAATQNAGTVVDLTVTLSGETNNGNSAVGQPVSVATVTEAGVAVTSGLTYQWELDNNPIANATMASYTPLTPEEGHQLSVLVTDTVDGDATTQYAGTVTDLVVTLSGVSNDGNTTPGQPVTVVTVTEAGTAVTSGLTYQWELDNNPISGQTTASYTPLTPEEGHQLSVLVTDTADGDVTTEYAGEVTELAVTLSGVTNNGTSTPGQPVTVATVTEAGVAVTSGLTYQWELDNNPISGQTTASYTPLTPEEGHQLSVLVTDTADGDATTQYAGTVTELAVTLSGESNNGNSTPGQPVTVATVTEAGTAVISGLTYQWELDNSLIANATTASYAPLTSEEGHQLSVLVTDTADGDATTQYAGTVTDLAVTLSGVTSDITSTPGQPVTVATVTEAGVAVASSDLVYQWELDNNPISGQTTASYTPLTSDEGHQLLVAVIDTVNGDHTTESVGTVTDLAVTLSGLFNGNSGSPSEGQAVSVAAVTEAGVAVLSADLTYQWQIDNSTPISGQTTASYTPAVSDEGHLLSVVITDTADGDATTEYAGTVTGGNTGLMFTDMMLTVSQGGTTPLTNSDFGVTDPGVTNFLYSVVNNNVTGGEFEIFNGTNWVAAPADGFTTAQIADGDVEFVQDGTATAPSFIIEAEATGSNAAYIRPTVIFQIATGGFDDFVGAFDQNVAFAGFGILELAQSQQYTGTISGYSDAAVLDLSDINFINGQTLAMLNGADLTVTDMTHTANIAIDGTGYNTNWYVLSDGQFNNGNYGTLVVDPDVPVSSAGASASGAQMVLFTDGTGTLTYTGSGAEIAGFTGTAPDAADSDVIDLTGINYDPGMGFSDTYDPTTGLLTVTDGNPHRDAQLCRFHRDFQFCG